MEPADDADASADARRPRHPHGPVSISSTISCADEAHLRGERHRRIGKVFSRPASPTDFERGVATGLGYGPT